MELCKDKDKLKKERADAKALRGKIVGVGNTIDSYGDKFLSANTDKNDKNYYEARKVDNNSYQKANKESNGLGNMGTYDQYQSSKTLSERIGNILEGVNRLEEKQNKGEDKKLENKQKDDKSTKNSHTEIAELDLLDFGDEKPVTKPFNNKKDEVNFLDM